MDAHKTLCAFVRPDGRLCRALAMRGSTLCYWHDPATAEDRANGVRPARRRRHSPPILTEPPCLASAADIEALLTQVTSYLASGEDVQVGRAVALTTAASHLLRAINVRKLEAELSRLRVENNRLTNLNAYLGRLLRELHEQSRQPSGER